MMLHKDHISVSKTEITNIASGSRIIVRRKFVIGKNKPQGWVQSEPITVL